WISPPRVRTGTLCSTRFDAPRNSYSSLSRLEVAFAACTKQQQFLTRAPIRSQSTRLQSPIRRSLRASLSDLARRLWWLRLMPSDLTAVLKPGHLVDAFPRANLRSNEL